MADFLQVSPNKLVFALKIGEQSETKLSLVNPTSEIVAFKVKTTAPALYSVKPAAGLLEPGARWEATVVRAAAKQLPASGEKCKDKFRVEALTMPPGVHEASSELFHVNKQAVEGTNIKVALIAAQNTPIAAALPPRPSPAPAAAAPAAKSGGRAQPGASPLAAPPVGIAGVAGAAVPALKGASAKASGAGVQATPAAGPPGKPKEAAAEVAAAKASSANEAESKAATAVAASGAGASAKAAPASAQPNPTAAAARPAAVASAGAATASNGAASGKMGAVGPGKPVWNGQQYVGRAVVKQFGGAPFKGEVQEYDPDTSWFLIKYEDSDMEEIDWRELQGIMQPRKRSSPAGGAGGSGAAAASKHASNAAAAAGGKSGGRAADEAAAAAAAPADAAPGTGGRPSSSAAAGPSAASPLPVSLKGTPAPPSAADGESTAPPEQTPAPPPGDSAAQPGPASRGPTGAREEPLQPPALGAAAASEATPAGAPAPSADTTPGGAPAAPAGARCEATAAAIAAHQASLVTPSGDGPAAGEAAEALGALGTAGTRRARSLRTQRSRMAELVATVRELEGSPPAKAQLGKAQQQQQEEEEGGQQQGQERQPRRRRQWRRVLDEEDEDWVPPEELLEELEQQGSEETAMEALAEMAEEESGRQGKHNKPQQRERAGSPPCGKPVPGSVAPLAGPIMGEEKAVAKARQCNTAQQQQQQPEDGAGQRGRPGHGSKLAARAPEVISLLTDSDEEEGQTLAARSAQRRQQQQWVGVKQEPSSQPSKGRGRAPAGDAEDEGGGRSDEDGSDEGEGRQGRRQQGQQDLAVKGEGASSGRILTCSKKGKAAKRARLWGPAGLGGAGDATLSEATTLDIGRSGSGLQATAAMGVKAGPASGSAAVLPSFQGRIKAERARAARQAPRLDLSVKNGEGQLLMTLRVKPHTLLSRVMAAVEGGVGEQVKSQAGGGPRVALSFRVGALALGARQRVKDAGLQSGGVITVSCA